MSERENDLDLSEFINRRGFSWADLMGLARWSEFTVTRSGFTSAGVTTTTGRYIVIGPVCMVQYTMRDTIGLTSVAGTSYVALPLAAKGRTGVAFCSDDTTNLAEAAMGHLDVTNSRLYPPGFGADTDTHHFFAIYEV